MGRKIYLLILLFLFFQPDCFADPISKAIKALQKGKHEQVVSILDKSLLKHPLNPGAHYAYSLLFYDSTYNHGNIDSAHYYIEQALTDARLPDSLEILPLEKAGLTIDQLQSQKSLVDQAAFSRAVELNTVEAFQYFIDHYQNSAQYSNAIDRRDLLAFEIASSEHTYASYKAFLDLYPDAYQAPVARERYELLVFQAKTADGKLQEFYDFLSQHPETPFRNQVEWNIFQLETLDDKPGSYYRFIERFPKSKYVSRANDILYHLDKATFMSGKNQSDSLSGVYQLESTALIPIFENGRYGFIDRYGKDQIAASVDSIPENYLCRLLTEDVFQAYVDEKPVLVTRNQTVLWEAAFDGFEDLGRGLLKISVGTKYGIIHKSGWLVLAVEYEDIKLLGNTFLAVKKDGYWGISSMTGRAIVAPVLEQVLSEGSFLLLKKNRLAVANAKQIIQFYESDAEFLFQYDDWEVLGNDHIMVFKGGQEGIINGDLESVIPVSNHEIHELDSADWYVKTEHGTIRFYGDNLRNIPHDRYQDFVSNNHFICLLKYPKWEIWNRADMSRINETLYDSVARLGTNLLVIREQNALAILFRNGKMVALDASQQVKLIRDADQSRGFLQINSTGGKRDIYDLDGNQVYQTWYYEVSPLTHQTFIIERNGIKGIVNLEGKVLLKPRYKTIVADSLAHITLLHNGRFGFFNPLDGSLIRPQYESRLAYFSEDAIMTTKGGKVGLIDRKNDVLVPFEFDQIRHWSDSAVAVLKEKQWSIINQYTGEELFTGITGFEWISHRNELKAIVNTQLGYGLLDNRQGMVLNPGFNDIINLGTAAQPVFFTEKYIPEADYFVVIYYNHDMEVIRKQIFDSGNYDQVYCF